MTLQRLFKVLGKGRVPCHGGYGKWPAKGKWREVEGPLVPCEKGLHLCLEKDLVSWLGDEIWEAEYEGEWLDGDDKIVVRKARLVRKLTTWNEKTARLFACDCAERVLPVFEKACPDDKRPRKAIETARRFANGKATEQQLVAAWDAAWDARDAARDAAVAAAWDAAGVAGASEREWQKKRLMEALYPKEGTK